MPLADFTILNGNQANATISNTPNWASGSPQKGNFLVCAVCGPVASISTPSGWTQAYTASSAIDGNYTQSLFYKTAAGGDTAPTFAGNVCGMLWEFIGSRVIPASLRSCSTRPSRSPRCRS